LAIRPCSEGEGMEKGGKNQNINYLE